VATLLTFTIFTASLTPAEFFAGLSPQNRVYDGILRALEIIDGTSCADDLSTLVPRFPTARALLGSGHCADISFTSSAASHTDGTSARDFTAPPREGGSDTVARE
jgi:hypothetical protein